MLTIGTVEGLPSKYMVKHLKKPLYIKRRQAAEFSQTGVLQRVNEVLSDRYTFVLSTKYRKDYKHCKKLGWDMKLLDETVKKLCRGEKLDDTQMDHPLEGDYQGYRECHIRFDWVFVYEIIDASYLKARRTGTHNEVYGK